MSLHSFLHRGDAPAASKRITIRRRLLGRSRRLPAVGLAAGLLSLGLASVQPVHAATKTWDGTVGDWYSSPTHWSPSGFPGAGDDAQNLFTNAAMTLGANATVNSFFSNSAFTLLGGQFSGSQAKAASLLTVNNIFTLNGGQINNFTIAAGVQQAGASAPAVLVSGSGNNSLSNTIVTANLDMTQFGGGAFLRLYNTNTIGTSTTAGSITLGTLNSSDNYGLRLNNTANLVIGGMGTLQGFGNVSEETAASTLTNNGLVNANIAGNILTMNQTFFTNTGAAEATNGGTLTINSNVTNTGAVKATGASSVVNLVNHTFTGTGSSATNLITASGGGVVNVNNESLQGTINTDAATALVIGVSNNNNLSNTTVNGNLDMTQAGNGAFLRIFGTDTINGMLSLGTVSSDGYGLRLNNGANLIISGGSTLQGFGNVSEETAASTLTNNGLVNANIAGNILTMNQTTFANKGTAEATNGTGGGGTLTINSNVTNTGAVKATGASSVVNLQNATFTGSGTAAQGNLITASGGGVVNVNNESLQGTINTDAATALVIGVSNNNNLSNTTVNGNLDMTQAGNGAFLRIFGTDTINGMLSLGTVSSDGYGLRLNNGANLIISGGSTLQGFGNVSEETAASTLTNNGLVNANIAGNPLIMNQTFFTNTAAATAEATNGGTLTINSNVTNTGAIKAVGGNGSAMNNVGSVVNLVNHTFTGTGSSATNLITASGGGVVNVNNENLVGTINTDAATALVISGSNGNSINGNNGSNSTVINGNLDLTGAGSGAFLRIFGTDTINGTLSLGTVSSDGYGLRLNNGANLIISGGSTLQGFGNVSEETAASMLTNNGLVNANITSNILIMDQNTFANTGTAEATNGGILTLNDNVTNTGAIKAVGGNGSAMNNVGSVVNLVNHTFTGVGSAASGNLITASTITTGAGKGIGVVNVNNESLQGTINTDAATALMIGTSGGNNLSNTTVNGNLSLTDPGTGSFLRLYGTDTLNGTLTLATVNSSDGYGLRLNNGANLIISIGSTLQGSGNVSEETAASTLTNNGLVNATTNFAGSTLTMDQRNFINTGTAEATNGGILTLNDNVSNSGAVKAVGTSSVVNLQNATFTGSGTAAQGNLITASGGGVVNVNNESLQGTINTDAATALMIGTSGGNNLSNTTVNGNLSLTDPGTASFLRLYGTDTVNGTLTLATVNSSDGYGLRLNNTANLVIGSTGTLQGSGNVSEETAASTFTNNGLISPSANGAGSTLTFSETNFKNTATGTTQVANGTTLTVNSANATNSGAISVIQGGTANFTSGLTQTAGATNVFGTLNASEALKGGVLEGFGKVVGNVTNTGGTVQSTTPAGLVIQGNFTQTGGGELDAFFGNNFHDLLTVTGQTTLGGTLGVFDLDPSQPAGMAAAGSQFAFLDYSGTLAATGTSGGFTQYFSNETPIDNNTGLIMGASGFQYELINDTTHDMLDLEVIKAGSPVPEASTTVSFGLLLALGLGGLVLAAKRKKKA